MSIPCATEVSRKETASELAALLSAGAADYSEVCRLLSILGYSTDPVNVEAEGQEYRQNGHVGIYMAEMVNGNTHYIRDVEQKNRWSFCADVPIIYPKGNKKRVVLLGESVARGFLLDPDYTPAFVLESLLKIHVGLFETEVIDLAETNLGMPGIKRRYRECFALDPDVIVFLAGNNWRADLIDYISVNSAYLERVEEAILATDGIRGIKNSIEDIFREILCSFLKEVGKLSEINKVPVVFVIPEFNLLDFQSSPGQRAVTRIANGNISRWVSARDAAEKALAAKDYAELELQAEIMILLDPSHPLGYELKARGKFLQGCYDEARDCLEEARDTALYCRASSLPRVFKVIRDTIRNEAATYGIHAIDLPDIFKTHLGGKIPGRDLFLDYCHFTIEGIQIAVEAMASEIVKLLSGKETACMGSAGSIKASSETIAMGHLFAAIHNAHWGQSEEILDYHCLQSVKHSPDTHKIMIYYIDMISRNTSNTLCKSFQKLLDFDKMYKYVHALIHPKKMKSMETTLVKAMVKALKYTGIKAEFYANDIRLAEHSVNNRKINLLMSHYHSTCYDEYEGAKKAFFQARDTSSRFMVIAKKGTEITLDVTLRVPGTCSTLNEITLSVNGIAIERLEGKQKWQTHSIRIPGGHVIDGINMIMFEWPMPDADESMPVRGTPAATRQSKGRLLLDIAYCVFGELYSLYASVITGRV